MGSRAVGWDWRWHTGTPSSAGRRSLVRAAARQLREAKPILYMTGSNEVLGDGASGPRLQCEFGKAASDWHRLEKVAGELARKWG